jgi:hypothetical protein
VGWIDFNWTDGHPRFVTDVTGDGRADLVGFGDDGVSVALSRGGMSFQPSQLAVAAFGASVGGWQADRHPRFLADVSGDGRADIVGFGEADVYVALSNGDGSFQALVWAVGDFCYAQGWRIEAHPRFLADITGDGRADIVGFGNDGVYVSLSNGDGGYQPAQLVLADFAPEVNGWQADRHLRVLADVTGDGRADIVGFGEADVYVALSNGDGSFQAPVWAVGGFCAAQGWGIDAHPRFLADITGDGRADIVGFGDDGVYVSLSNGDGSYQPAQLALADLAPNVNGWRADRHPRVLADVTGDGRADIVGFGDTDVYVALSNGDGSFQAPVWAVGGFGYAQGWRIEAHGRFLADISGDGRADIVGFGDDGVHVSSSNGDGTYKPAQLAVASLSPQSWRASRMPGPGAVAGGARLAAIAKPVGCELWWIGADGAVNGKWSEPGSEWADYLLAGPQSAAPNGGISAVSKDGDLMEVWWIGPDGSVQAAYHEGEWKLYALAGPGSAAVTGGLAGIFKGGDVMEVWWIGPDGSVQAAYHEGEWKPYTLAGPGSASVTGSITAVAKGGDVMEVWWIGPDGSVQAAYHEGEWKPYALAGAGAAATTGGITAVFKSDDAMEVWWVAPDGAVMGGFHDGEWKRYMLSGAGSASATCRITSSYGGSLNGNVTRLWWVDPAGTLSQAFDDGGGWATMQIGAGADPAGATVGVLFNPDTPTAFWALPDGSLVDACPPEITLAAKVSGGRGLSGTVWLTLREDGSTRWHGDVTNDEPYGYNFGLSVFAQTGTHIDIGAAHHGQVAGWGEPGGSIDIWDEQHNPNPLLASGLAAYRFSALAIRLEHSIDLVDYLKAIVDGMFEVAWTVGSPGGLLVLGAEIVSGVTTGSLVPGAIIAGGVPWISGPAGIFVRLVVTAAHDDGRTLTQEEYDWANDTVFKGSLPPIDSFRITNYLGIGNRPFTFPTFAGPVLVNLGDKTFKNIHADEQTVIHELTHVCQLAHTQNVLFTAKAIVTQIANSLGDDAYDYGVAGFDYTDIGYEAQAEVVEDWFLGQPAKPKNPEPRNHTGIARDAQSPYYPYITDNVRIGRF